MKLLTLALSFFIANLAPTNNDICVEEEFSGPILQVSGECPGDVFTFTTNLSGSYTWQAFNGATILSGQGTSTVSVQSPSASSPTNGGFRIDLINNGTRHVQLALFGTCESEHGNGGSGTGTPGPGGNGPGPLPSGDGN